MIIKTYLVIFKLISVTFSDSEGTQGECHMIFCFELPLEMCVFR